MSLSVIEVALKVSAVMAVAGAAAGIMRRRSSATARHLVWTLAAAGVLAVPLGSLGSTMMPHWRIPIRRATVIHMIDPPPLVRPGPTPQDSLLASEKTDETPPLAAAPMMWTTWLPVAYLAGVVFLLIRLGADQWKIRWLVSRATGVTDPAWTELLRECVAQVRARRAVRLVRTSEYTTPMACGLRRPVVVIPSIAETWDADRRRAVLLHEIAHVMRFDCLTQLLAELMVAVYWVHPGAWWIARRLCLERELACDDFVLASGTEPHEYAGHLLEIAYSLGGYRAPALAVRMARPRQLEERMRAILDATRNRTALAPSRRVVALAMTALVVVPLAVATTVVDPVVASGQTPQGKRTVSTSPAAQTTDDTASLLPGTWQLRTSADGRRVQLTLSERENSFHSTSMATERFEGLAPLLSGGGPGHFRLIRDAGTFDFEGTLRRGVGGGTLTFTPSATFPGELARRGFTRPTIEQQESMAWSDVGFDFINELAAQKYARPDLQQLVSAAQHGVSTNYVKEMADLGYRLGVIDALISQRDHGVSPQFIRDLKAQGLRGLTADDLVRARDHGVSREYVAELRTLGYAPLTLDGLVGARDHGISPDYVRELQQLGYRLSLVDLTRARDHGVSVEYVKDLAGLGYEHLSLDELVRLRDHGVSPDWLRAAKSGRPARLSIDELIRMRDRGVNRPEDLPPRLYSVNLRATLERWLARLLK